MNRKTNLAIVPERALPDWCAIDQISASLQEMADICEITLGAAKAKARGMRSFWQFQMVAPSRKHEGKTETRIKLKHLPRRLYRRLMRLRNGGEDRPLAHGKRGVVSSDDDARLAMRSDESKIVEGLFLKPGANAAHVFNRLKNECIRCHGGPLRAVDPSFRGRYKQHRCSNAACGFAVSYSTVSRITNKIPTLATTLAHDGINAFANLAIYIKRDWSEFEPNEEVVADNHDVDILLFDERAPYLRGGGASLWRPKLSAFQCMGTGGVGYVIAERANATTLALAFRAYVIRWGLPKGIVADNGSDYRSNQFLAFCESMKVAVRHTNVSKRGGESHAKSKPVERFFGSFERDFVKHLPGWCGSHPKERPADFWLLEKAHDEFLAGKRKTTPFLTIDQFKEMCANWVEQSFHKVPGARLDRSPNDVYANWMGTPRRVPERDMDMLMMPPVERTLGRRGVVIDYREYWNSEFIGLENCPAQVRIDPMDISKAIVVIRYSDLPKHAQTVPGRDKLIVAYYHQLVGKGATKEDFEEANRRKKTQRRFYREFIKSRQSAASGVSTLDEVLAEKAAGEPVPQMAVNGTPIVTEGRRLSLAMKNSVPPVNGPFMRVEPEQSEPILTSYIPEEFTETDEEPVFSSLFDRMVWEKENGSKKTPSFKYEWEREAWEQLYGQEKE